jgi:hypothetical protein
MLNTAKSWWLETGFELISDILNTYNPRLRVIIMLSLIYALYKSLQHVLRLIIYILNFSNKHYCETLYSKSLFDPLHYEANDTLSFPQFTIQIQ